MKAPLASPSSQHAYRPCAPTLSRSLVWLFAIASGLSVANVYFAQPLLDALARDFSMSHAAVGGVIAATQTGCALALLFLVPLGDRVDRRRLMGVQLLLLMSALIAVGMATSAPALLTGMVAIGMLGTAMTQGLIAYAASASAPTNRVMWWARHRAGCSLACYWQGCLLAASAILRAGAGSILAQRF